MQGTESMHVDVFNGDADGICALHQLRLAEPVNSELITGVKRDVSLLSQVKATAGDVVTVLDISLDKNRSALHSLLDSGVSIHYFDHHFAGNIPDHPGLHACIDTHPEICTSLLVNRKLDGRYLAWAVTAAFGDNLHDSAHMAAKPLRLADEDLEQLKQLGNFLNYNGYGSSLEDLFYHPAELYRKIRAYEDPLDFISADEAYLILRDGYQADMAQASQVKPEYEDAQVAVYFLPDKKWSRRVSGVFGNNLAQAEPDRAHAVLTRKRDGMFQVSVRAPLRNRTGADTLCRQFASGGGRQAAAGINSLPPDSVEMFVQAFQAHFSS